MNVMTLNILAEAYESITSSVLDEVCPVITKERTIRPRLPWYNENIHIQRRVRRKLEPISGVRVRMRKITKLSWPRKKLVAN